MTPYIAYGENGKNKYFEKQGDLLAYFETSRKKLTTALIKGKPVLDPDTKEKYYIDELDED